LENRLVGSPGAGQRGPLCASISAATTKRVQPVEPLRAPGVAARFDHADQARADRANAAEAENVALQAAQATSPEVPAVEESRHAHRDHDPGRSPFEQLARQSARFVEGEPRTQDVLEESLEQRGHGSEPKGIQDQEVIRPKDRVLRISNVGDRCGPFELGFGAQDREVEARHVDPPQPVHVRSGRRPDRGGPE
jgi:hypothetical protein